MSYSNFENKMVRIQDKLDIDSAEQPQNIDIIASQ